MQASAFLMLARTGFDLSGCPGGIHALKFVQPTQDWLSFIIWDRPKTDQKIFLKSIPEESIKNYNPYKLKISM